MDERIRWWSYRRQRLGGAAVSPAEALRDVVGVYSAHPSAPLSLHARCPNLDAAGFRALDGLRLPAMRGSIHLLPRETAHLAFHALREAPARAAARLRYFGVTEAVYARLGRRVVAAAGTPVTARQLREATGAGEELKGVIGGLTREGRLMRVGADGLRSNALRYVACALPEADPDAALGWLAREYLRAFGPARPADFAWWTGAPAARAERALDAVETIDVGDGLRLAAEDREGFERVRRPRRGAVDLLPKWDAYTMGYPRDGRERFAAPEALEHLYDFRGDGLPAVLVDGAAAGTWSIAPGARRVEVELHPFEAPGPRLRAALDARVDAVRALLS